MAKIDKKGQCYYEILDLRPPIATITLVLILSLPLPPSAPPPGDHPARRHSGLGRLSQEIRQQRHPQRSHGRRGLLPVLPRVPALRERHPGVHGRAEQVLLVGGGGAADLPDHSRHQDEASQGDHALQ